MATAEIRRRLKVEKDGTVSDIVVNIGVPTVEPYPGGSNYAVPVEVSPLFKIGLPIRGETAEQASRLAKDFIGKLLVDYSILRDDGSRLSTQEFVDSLG